MKNAINSKFECQQKLEILIIRNVCCCSFFLFKNMNYAHLDVMRRFKIRERLFHSFSNLPNNGFGWLSIERPLATKQLVPNGTAECWTIPSYWDIFINLRNCKILTKILTRRHKRPRTPKRAILPGHDSVVDEDDARFLVRDNTANRVECSNHYLSCKSFLLALFVEKKK